MAAAGLQTSIWNNNIRSIILLIIYPIVMAAIIGAIAYVVGFSHSHNPHIAQNIAIGFMAQYWPAILTVIVIWFMISYFFNGAMVRALSQAKPVTRQEQPELYNLLENLCISQGMKTPQINIIQTDAMNAFASGVDERTYCVTVTSGILNALSKDELEAVLAHELTHIINRDVRLMMVCVIFTGMIGFTAQIVWSNLRYGMIFRGNRDRDENNNFFFIMMAAAVILWIGYLITLFTRFALSRRRESMADEGGVKMTKNPEALMRALMRISGNNVMPHTTEDVNMMCIENDRPFLGLFSTHPPIAQRIREISEMTHTPIPQLESSQSHQPVNPWQHP